MKRSSHSEGVRLSEMQKYAIFTTCLTETANEYNKTNFPIIKAKLALVCKTMLMRGKSGTNLWQTMKAD